MRGAFILPRVKHPPGVSLPQTADSCSDLRQIPDNQEVFLSPASETSVVLEVLAMVEEGLARTDLWEAVKWVCSPPTAIQASYSSSCLP
jgi:hypothetical protein